MFRKKKKPTHYHGKTIDDLEQVMYRLCDLEDDIAMTDEEYAAMDIAINCISSVMNAMATDRKIIFDD